jgi:Tfp pilus assembly protein PilV
MAVKPCQNRSQAAFTVLEALFASATLALGLLGSFQLSTASMAANQSQRNLDFASGLAQDLAECWQVPNDFCISQFQSSQNASTFSTESGIQFEKTVIHLILITGDNNNQVVFVVTQ